MPVVSPPALASFSGSPTVALLLPEESPLDDTWLGTQVPSKQDRTDSMELQTDGDSGLTSKEKTMEVNQAMSKITLFDADYTKDNSTFDFRSGHHSFKAMGHAALRGVFYLSTFKVPGVGKVGPFLMAAAFPSGPSCDDPFVFGDDIPKRSSSANRTHSTSHHSLLSGNRVDDENPFLWQPGNIEAPASIKPILLSIRRDGLAPLLTPIEEWWTSSKNSMIVIPRGNKLTHPVSLICDGTDIPPLDSPFIHFFVGEGTHTEYPRFEDQEHDPPICALASTATAGHAMCVQSVAFLLPTGHCFPLGVPFDLGKCGTVADLKIHLMDFTGYSDDCYKWLDDIPTLPVWLRACTMEPNKMTIDSLFMFDAQDSWDSFTDNPSEAHEHLFLFPELSLRAKMVIDNVWKSMVLEKKGWTEKLSHYLQLSIQAINNTPQLAAFHRANILDAPFVFALCDPKISTWRAKFHIPFLKTNMPKFLAEFKVLQLPGQKEPVPAPFCIISKNAFAAAQTPDKADKNTAPPNAGDLLASMFGANFKTVSSPAHIRTQNSAESDDERKPPARVLERRSGATKRSHSDEHTIHSIEVLRVTRPRQVYQLPDFGVTVASVLSASEYMLPCEQPESRLVDLYTTNSYSHPDFLLPSPKKYQSHPHVFTREGYINGTLGIHQTRLAFLGCHSSTLSLDIGPSSAEVYPASHRLMPGYLSLKFACQVYGIKSSDKEKLTTITTAKPANVSAFFQSAYKAAVNQNKFSLYCCPAIDCFDMFERPEYIQAVQSAAFASGLRYKTHQLTSALTPWHFISTIQESGMQLPAAGLTSLNMFKYGKNFLWFLHEMFHMPDRYDMLELLHRGASPWVVASPFAGNMLYLFKRFNVHEFSTAWDALSGPQRLQATGAVIIHVGDLIEIMSDFADTDNGSAHCIEAHLHDSPERSDILILRPIVHALGSAHLKSKLQEWRTTIDEVFTTDSLRAVSLPTKGPFNKLVPPDILPAQRHSRETSSNSSLRRDGRFSGVQFQSDTRLIPVADRRQTHDRPPARPADRIASTSRQNGGQARQETNQGTYRRVAARALLVWQDDVRGAELNINHLMNDWSRQGIVIPKVDGRHICMPYIIRDHAGCSGCRREHIDTPSPSITRASLRQLSDFISDERVATKLRKTQAFLDIQTTNQDHLGLVVHLAKVAIVRKSSIRATEGNQQS
ncbi:hypothetical protein MPSEU_000332700 [Mayamaea pseudoterrestris]|nr:hypothetical protein MPSEU_000332700 [Mayamaea pseudoterrestris]